MSEFLIVCGGIAIAIAMAQFATTWLLLFVPSPDEVKSQSLIDEAQRK